MAEHSSSQHEEQRSTRAQLPRYQPIALRTGWSVWDRFARRHVQPYVGGNAQRLAEERAQQLNENQLAVEREDYASLADEMNDADVGPWAESDWDAGAVANARRYAAQHGLRFPPALGDYDRFYETTHGERS